MIAIATLAQLLTLRSARMKAFRGEILSVPDDPAVAGADAIRHYRGRPARRRGRAGRRLRPYADLADTFAEAETEQLDGLIVPGFVDAHVHYPQIERIASHGEQLMQWLERHIFPAEKAFADRGHADAVAAFFLDELLRHGTTSALVFATVHAGSVDALFEAALDARHADRLRQGADGPGARGPARHDRLRPRRHRGPDRPMARPRPARLCGHAALRAHLERRAARRCRRAWSPRIPDVLMHTHLSENPGEIAFVAERFPEAADYLDVYDRFGLVGPRSVFAHCVHMSDRALSRMAEAGAGIAFCPTSNLFLGSGLFDLAAADRHGVRIGIGTDIGAGTSLSMLHTLGEAYRICQLRGASLDPFRALHLATAGGARVMGIADRVGALLPGQEADFILLDAGATPLLARRCAGASLHDRLFALQVLGDDRAIAATYLRGRRAHSRPG